jgi:hypothetical protein
MPKELLERLNGILDWWKIEDFTDRKEIEKELTSLLDDAYSQGWSDAKDDSFFFEDCMRDDGNLVED